MRIVIHSCKGKRIERDMTEKEESEFNARQAQIAADAVAAPVTKTVEERLSALEQKVR